MASKMTRYQPAAPALVDQRAEPRHPVFITRASVRRHSEPPIEAALHDLSAYGCRIACSEEPDAGDRIWLRFQGGMPIAATVIWSNQGFAGCRFDEPIERSLVRALTLRTD
ncbi:PilZ domain-containing protein [Stakelama marina]|uniref:PilZ domain-containing protein n=1 Tax=Stakelama marina TaxID=2826939 RepID=A0A8T4IG76_9SPHN|nr:PilZ domain-containing protein [Stakelama marina]MBR0552884.1 PilZ domain-containing protein [Stakelama marina]